MLNQLKELVNKPVLKNLSRYTIKFQQYVNMKRALNLSSRSIVHEWSTVGLGGIPGYSTYVGNATKAARFLKMGGYVGIAFSFAGPTNDVMKACTVGREGECSRSAFKEYSKFGLSTAAGIGAGAAGSAIGLGFLHGYRDSHGRSGRRCLRSGRFSCCWLCSRGVYELGCRRFL